MKNRLVIVGAGAFGRVVHSWLDTSPQFLARNHIEDIVFIDDGIPSVAVQTEIIGKIADFVPAAGDILLCAIGNSRSRKIVTSLLEERGARFVTFISDQAVIGHRVIIGEGSVICPGVVIQPNTKIGKHVHVGSNCAIGHDTLIGNCTSLSPMVNLMSSITIGESVFFGGSSTIIPGLAIANEVLVGAGAVVTKDVPAGVTVKGIPGKW